MTILTRSLSVLALFAFAASAAVADDNNDDHDFARIISVTGEGEVSAPPDMATIRTGVVTQADTAKKALNANNAAMEKILTLLKDRGIAKKDIQTTNFNIQPIYDRDEEGRREPEVVGYRVENQVRVEVRKLDSLGEILDALVSAGSNRISGISFGVEDPSDLLNKARAKAIENAKERASVYAKAAGVEVGPIIQISEQPVAVPQPERRFGAMAMRAEAASVPVASGEEEFRVTVDVVYQLQQGEGE